ncbi:MAG: T9SS type A sorting domain-containing protein [Bacteroidia bacterium]
MMTKLYSLIFVMALMMALSLTASAQRVVLVPGWDPASGTDPDSSTDVLYDAIIADSTGRANDPSTVYELVRGHLYPQGRTIENFGYHLRLRAQSGSGLLPQLTPGKNASGAYGADFIRAQNDLTVENIAFSGYRPDGAYLNRMFELRAKGSTVRITGCIFDGDRGAAITLMADSLKVFVYDVRAGNLGHRITVGGNGRLIDLRPEAPYVDTLVIVNTTTYNSSDRIIRNMGTVVNYLKIDHMTAFNTVGFHGGLQLGLVHHARVTNSLFANVISLGHNQARTTEQTQPEKHFSVISLDSIFAGQIIDIRNNNIYFDQALETVWAKYDSVEAPYYTTHTLDSAVAIAGHPDPAYFTERLTFTQVCGPIDAYVDAYFTDPAAATFPENWCVGGEGGYFPDELDASYSTTSTSYTAADNGFPVGDLNYWPTIKEQWMVTAIDDDIRKGVSSLTTYPNPFSTYTTIAYELATSGQVSVEVFDFSGRKVATLFQGFQIQGSHEVNFEAGNLSDGMYLATVKTSNGMTTRKMVLKK